MSDDDFDLEWELFKRECNVAGARDDPDPDGGALFLEWQRQRMADVSEFGPQVLFNQLNDRLEEEINRAAFQLRAADEDLQQREASLRERIADGESSLQEQARALEAVRAELRTEVDKVAAARQAFDSIDPELLGGWPPSKRARANFNIV
jgi:hypothetical protein